MFAAWFAPLVALTLLPVLGGHAHEAPGAGAEGCHGSPARVPSPPPADVDAMLWTLHDLYAGLPGFVDVYYFPGGPAEYRPLFAFAVPLAAKTVPTPVPVAFDVLAQAPAKLDAGATPSANDLLCSSGPTPIRPGARLSTPLGTCTLSFVFKAGTKTYVGTAGHCLNTGDTAEVQGVGVVGTAAFSTGDAGVGNDFAVIEVLASLVPKVSPEMCDWAGPTGAFTGSGITGQATVQTGYGGGVPGGVPPRPLTGIGTGYGATSFTWIGGSIPGDSGSAIRLHSGQALGTVTHLGVGVVGDNFGTRLDRGVALAAAGGVSGLTLQTVSYTHL